MSETIKVPGIYDVSGPTGSVGRPTSYGTRDAIKFVNENGFLTHEIEHEWVDYQRDVALAEEAYTDFTSENPPPAIIGWGAGDTTALADRIADDEVVYISASYSPQFHRPSYSYLFLPSLDYTSQVRAHMEWLKEHDPNAKVALSYPDRPLGHVIKEGSHQYATELGIEMGTDLHLPVDADTAKEQVSKASQENVDYIIHHNISHPTKILLEDIESISPDIEVLGLSWTVDEIQLANAPELHEGVRVVNTFNSFREVRNGTSRADNAIRAAFRAYRSAGAMDDPELANLHYVRGFLHGLLLYKALKLGEQHGLDVQQGPELRQAMFEVNEWDAWGVSEPLSFSRDDPRSTMSGRIYEVHNGALHREGTIDLPRKREWIGV